jgi:hypothetical protein
LSLTNRKPPVIPRRNLQMDGYTISRPNGKLTAGVGANDRVVARAISVSGGTLKFRLLI